MTSDEHDELQETIDIVRRRQKFFRRPHSAGKLVAKVLTRHAVAGEQASQEIGDAWQNAAAGLAKGSRPAQIKRNTLEILVANSSTMSKLQFQKRVILRKLQALDGYQHIKDLKFKIG